jgi:hypothetical protein
MKKNEMSGARREHEIRNVNIMLVGKHEKRRPLGRLTHRWEYNIKIDRGKVLDSVYWIHLAQGRDR